MQDPNMFDSVDQYVLSQSNVSLVSFCWFAVLVFCAKNSACIQKTNDILVETSPGSLELKHKHTGRLSSALARPFQKTPMSLYVAGLFGCTSVVIISEMGVWFSHHWEASG